MNYDGVPDHFDEMEHDYAANINPMSSGFSSHKAAANENEIMEELLWQNGQVMVQKSSKKSSTTPSVGAAASVIPAEQPVVREIRSAEEQQHLFMQEDEMASWLHYPVLDESSNFSRDFYGTDLFYPTQPPPASTADGAEIRQPLVPPRQPIPPPAAENISSPSQLQNFVHFSRLPSKPITSKPSAITPTDLTVGESNDTPMAGKESSVPYSTADDCRRQANTEGVTAAAPANRELANAVTCELTAATSSPSGSGTSFSASAEARPPTPKQDPPAADVADGKRKDRETDDNENRNEDIEIEVNRQAGRTTSASTKRSRAAEVHNQSERRRRDRINEKMKALQELIPRCNKSDKASMLDEAIEYLKSLQMQVQMMSMGCGGMVPMMYPGMQQYMPAMGMGMGMGMNQTMLPYPSSMLQVPAGSAMPNPAAHIGPRTPIPGFHMPHHHTRIQPSNHHDLMINSLLSHNANHPPMQNLVDPYQQFGQLPIPQNQAMMQHNIKPSISKEVGDPENKQSGRKWL